jgi:2-polyprenyl-3-methyl-5-hydroxy-6-metoxy-1,4-benzoquinol methylase
MAGEDSAEYTALLVKLQMARWKRLLHVQAPYGWYLRRICRGRVLEIGCGIGRCLALLRGRGVGIDTNLYSVQVCHSRGLVAFTPDEFAVSDYGRPGRFDTLLLAHVAEHMPQRELVELIRGYLGHLEPHGRIVLVTPQERGYASQQDVHVEFMDFATLVGVLAQLGFRAERQFSFPLPRFAGRWFVYNEFVVTGVRPPRSS